VRIGTLGCARITPMALLRPARATDDAEVVAVAARDPERARAFASKRGIPRVHDSYEELLADPDIDAVYNPLPNSHHATWTIKALEAGKHVMCEKPFASNAAEAKMVAAAAETANRVVMEAFHWRYHPMAQRMIDIVAGGDLGEIRHVETTMCIPLPMRNDIRWKLDLAGGSQMDVGSYTTHMLRHLAGEEPEVVGATAKEKSPGIDRWMQATYRFPSGATGRTTASMMSARLLDIRARVVGSGGELRALNPTAPQIGHRLSVRSGDHKRSERFERRHTYAFQLDAFVAAVRDGAPTLTPPSDSIATMEVIDAVYEASGLGVRPGLLTDG